MTQRDSDLLLYGNYFETPDGERLDPLNMEIEESTAYCAEGAPFVIKYRYRLPSGEYREFSPKDITHKTIN